MAENLTRVSSPIKNGMCISQIRLFTVSIISVFTIGLVTYTEDVAFWLSLYRPNDEFSAHLQDLKSLWTRAANAVNRKELYSKDFNVDGILTALQTSAILNVSLLEDRTAQKWLFTLEGGQRALFKPRFFDSVNRTYYNRCEHPEHEVTGFILNRMFQMRNMPFVTGRRINWYRDILPVATQAVKDKAKEVLINGTARGVRLHCKRQGHGGHMTFSFPNGDMIGSVSYWYERPITELLKKPFMYKNRANLSESSPEYKEELREHCSRLQNKYNSSTWFTYIVNTAVMDFLMLRKTLKPAFIPDSQGNCFLNVVIDRGNGFNPRRGRTLDLIRPILQCCRIVQKTYNILTSLKDNFTEEFLEMSKTDPLYPLLSEGQMEEMKTSYTILMDVIDACIQEHGKDAVMIK